MGVKYFFPYIKKNFPTHIKNIDGNIDEKIDTLFLDFNGIIHTSTRTVLDRYGKRLLRKPNPINKEEIFKHICDYIQHLLLLVNPRKKLVIMIDGIAPLSKINQQRMRRYKNQSITQDNFDTNCISPSTEFMRSLTKYLQKYIKESLETNPFWSNLEIIFSSDNISSSSLPT